MSTPASSRQVILDRIRKATSDVSGSAESAYAALPRHYIRKGALNADDRLKLMIERLREYDAEVVETTPETLPLTIASRLAASGRKTFLAPSGLPPAWHSVGFDWKVDRGFTAIEMERAEGVVTSASCGIADSGTIVLHHTADQGRRAITLLPDWHLCILFASQVVETLPEYFDRFPDPPRLATYISGPSATADIEMTRIKGVHGPRFLHVIIVRDEK